MDNISLHSVHFENLPDIIDHPGTFDILLLRYFALGHNYFNLTYYLDGAHWEAGYMFFFFAFHFLNCMFSPFYSVWAKIKTRWVQTLEFLFCQ